MKDESLPNSMRGIIRYNGDEYPETHDNERLDFRMRAHYWARGFSLFSGSSAKMADHPSS